MDYGGSCNGWGYGWNGGGGGAARSAERNDNSACFCWSGHGWGEATSYSRWGSVWEGVGGGAAHNSEREEDVRSCRPGSGWRASSTNCWIAARSISSRPRVGSVAAALEDGYSGEERLRGGAGGQVLDFLGLLPSKDWVPFGAFELDPGIGAWGAPGGTAVDFYLKPSLMPVGGFAGWKSHPIYQKDLAFIKKDSSREVRLNKEIATRWSSQELLAFADVRHAEFDVANVITTVHRIAKSSDRWFVKRDRRLKQVIAQAVGIICEPERKAVARDAAKTIWAMARVGSTDRQVQDQLSEEIKRRLEAFEPQGLSNIMWSYARLGPPREVIMEGVVEAFWRLVRYGSCEPQALSNTTWALAKLVVMNVPMLADISTEVIKKAHEFDPQGLANTTWAFATLQLEDLAMFDRIGDVLAADPSRWRPQNMANLTWAYAKVQISHTRMLDAVASETASTIEDWNTQGLANIAWAYAKLGVNYSDLFGRISSAVIQKVRTFTPQNTVNIAWAFAKLCIAKADLMDAVAQDVVLKSKDFSPQHCSNIAWAFGTAGLLNEDMMESLAGAVASGIAEFNGQDLANVTWSCAKLVWTQTGMLDVVAGEVIRKVSAFTPQNVAITTWSFGCLAVANEPMMVTIAADFPSRIGEFGPQGLSNLAHGLAKLGIRDDKAMCAIGNEASKMLCDFTNQEFTMTAWAFAKLGVAWASIVDAVIAELKRRLSQLLPQDLATLAWSFARLSVARSKEALEELSWEVTKQVRDLSPQDLSNISWAYATAGFENAMMMEAISQEVVRKVDRFTAQDIANTSWAFAKLGITPSEMFDAIALAVTKKVSVLLPQNLSIVSWSYAKLGLLNDVMMEAVAEEIVAKIEGFDGQGIGNIMWAFGVLGLREHVATAQVVMERAIVIMDDLTAQEISSVAWSLSALGHMDLLHRFLPQSVSQFAKVVREVDGASWVDFANVVAIEARAGKGGPDASELGSSFCTTILEPVLERLFALLDPCTELLGAIEQMQGIVDKTGVPYLGSSYTRIALSQLEIDMPSPGDAWLQDAQKQCQEVVGGWQIPNMDSIVAFARWDVSLPGGIVGAPLQEPGRVFLSGWPEGIDDTIKELLHPFMQLTRRDMCAERIALLELVNTILHRRDCNAGLAQQVAFLLSCTGSVLLYCSHYPSLSSLGVFCQFRRHLPHVRLEFGFDNAWQSCCGMSRFEDVGK